MDLFSTSEVAKANEAPGELELKHPVSGVVIEGADGKPIAIRLLGQDSRAWQDHQRAITDRILGRAGRRAKAQTAEQSEMDAIAGLAAVTVGWSDNLTMDGAPLTFSRANATALYTKLRWVREQVDEFVGDRSNFLRT